MKSAKLIASLGALAGLITTTLAVPTAALFLKANGVDIQGDSSIVSMGRQNSIECTYFEMATETLRQAGSGLATGRRTYQPITIRKRIDKSSPLLARALTRNEVISGEFRFYRPNPTGDGTTEQYYTINITNGRIASIKIVSPSTADPATANTPMYEEVSFVFQTITWTYTNGGIQHTDTASGERSAAPVIRPAVRPPGGGGQETVRDRR